MNFDFMYFRLILSFSVGGIFFRDGKVVKICSVLGNLVVGIGILYLIYGVILYFNV